MRAIRFHSFGDPAEVLRVEDLPIPAPGPGQVLIRLTARPINPSDLFTIRGAYGVRPRLPATPGFEGAGVVEAIGEGVTWLQPGQLVTPGATTGTWQEYIVADAATVIPIPPGISDRQAAMLAVNPTTAWLMLTETLKVQPGEWVAQNAANSAVGRFVIQIARRQGFKTVNVVRRRDVIDELKALGADAVINEAEEDVIIRTRIATGGKGAPYALDAVAGESGGRLARALAPGGTMLVYGAQSGQPLTLDAGTMLFRGTKVQGWWLTQWFRDTPPDRVAGLFATLLPMIADGTLSAPIAGEYDLADIREAVRAAEGSQRNGKILLVG